MNNRGFYSNGRLKFAHPKLVLGFFFLLTFLIYFPTRNARFVFDFLDCIAGFKKYGLFESNYPGGGISELFIPRLLYFIWYGMFKCNPMAWHLLASVLHSVNAFLLFLLLFKLMEGFNYNHIFYTAFAGSLCFLLLPFHTEPVAWGGDLDFLLVGFFVLSGLYVSLLYFETRRNLFLALYLILFLSGSFSLELGLLIFPAALLLLALFPGSGFPAQLKHIRLFLVGSVTMYIIYFVNRILRGSLIGHYGAGVHLNFSPAIIVPAFIMYILKILLLFSFAPLSWQSRVIQTSGHFPVICAIFIALAVIILFYSILRSNKRYLLPFVLFILFVIFVFPVLNLYFPYYIKIEADRYCYLPSAFLLGSAVTTLAYLKNPLKYLFLALYIGFSMKYLHYNLKSWQIASELEHSLEKDFRWWNASHVYILNRPDNFRGAYMYRENQTNAWAPAFLKYGDSIPVTPITEILGYNMNQVSDSVIVEKGGVDKLKVTLSAWGTWFWRYTAGATSYEDELVKVTVDDYDHSYLVEFKKKNKNDVILYSANGKWREVKDFE